MSTNDAIVNTEEHAHQSKVHILKTDVYKNLRRRSPFLAFLLTISLPICLFLIHIVCSPREKIPESLEEIYRMLTFNFDCLAIVLGWLFFQVNIRSLMFFIIRLCVFFQCLFFLGIKSTHDAKIISRMIAMISSLIVVYLLNKWQIIRASYVYDNIHQICFTAIIVSYFIAFLLFIQGSRTRRGKQIHPMIAFFYGTDMNLTIGNVDESRRWWRSRSRF